MIEPRCEPGLVEKHIDKALAVRALAQVRQQALDNDELFKTRQAVSAGKQQLAHAASADFLQQLLLSKGPLAHAASIHIYVVNGSMNERITRRNFATRQWTGRESFRT